MGTQRIRHRRVEWRLPGDFPERLALFQEASGLSTRALAGLLGVSPYRLRRWKDGGAEPSPAHLFALLTISEAVNLRDGVLMCPEHDFPYGVDVEALRRRVYCPATAASSAEPMASGECLWESVGTIGAKPVSGVGRAVLRIAPKHPYPAAH